MSFRRFTGTDQKAMVCYVSAFSHQFSSSGESNYIPCSGDFSWNAVETCHREIKVATASPRNQKIGLLRFLSDYEGFFRKQVGQEREFSFEISNVGGMDVESGVDHCAGIDRIIFSQSSNVVGSALAFSIASVNGGDLAIALTWQKGIVEDDLAVKVLQTLEAELAAFACSQTN
jgi:hypothetical protein